MRKVNVTSSDWPVRSTLRNVKHNRNNSDFIRPVITHNDLFGKSKSPPILRDGKPLGLAKRSLEEQIMLQYAKDALQSPDGSWHVVINKEG